MSDIEREVLTTLVDLLKTGGQYALIGIAMWFGFQLMKIALIGGIIWGLIRSGLLALQHLAVFRLYKKGQHITLLGNQVGKHFEDCLEDFQKNVTAQVSGLVSRVHDLETSSKNPTAPTASPNILTATNP